MYKLLEQVVVNAFFNGGAQKISLDKLHKVA